MESYKPNENMISKKGSPKPYERKIKINQINQKKYIIEDFADKKEDEKIIDNNNKSQKENKDGQKIEIYHYTDENNENGENMQDNNNKNKYIQNNTEFGQNYQEMNEYNNKNERITPGPPRYNNINEKKNYHNELNNEQYIPDNEDNNEINVHEDHQFKYGEGNEENEQEKKYDNNTFNNNYKYKYKKITKTENNIEREEFDDNEQNEEGEENEGEDQKEEEENFDYQEMKKKPGKILHQSTQETYDEEGNRIVTTKTIKEFKQTTGGVRIRNIQNEKERLEYERYTTNNAKNYTSGNVSKIRKTHSTYKSDNKGDRLYLLAQLAKLKKDAEKNQTNQIYNTQSPIIIHETDGYENHNSMISNELGENNSLDEEMYARNYRTNYGKINRNYIISDINQDNDERYYYPSEHMKYVGTNGMMMQEEYFCENDSSNNRKDIPSPIGYIATYSSGSEDNEEMGRSYEYINRNINTKKKLDKNIYKKEGELIKKSEVIYQMEDPNDYIGFNEKRKNKKIHNLSNSVIRAQIDTSKSDKRDFQSPDRGGGLGSERFRKVTMAMISSLGPTCEDRKITRKMRGEVGGVVDLRQELNPINTYKIKKFQRYGNNLNKEINPKTKLEGARIIQYWWRTLKNRKLSRIRYIKIVKIQSNVRRYLIKKRITTTRITYYILETLDNIIVNHYRNDLFQLFKYYNEDKAKKKLIYIIKTLNEKKRKQKLLKYFYKFKFITDFLKNKRDYQTTSSDFQIFTSKKPELTTTYQKITEEKETKKTEITEEMYIKYIKEKYLNNNKSEHISEICIDKREKEKKPYEIENKTKYEIQKTKKELIDKETQDEYIKKETKDIGTQKEKENMIITNEGPISYLNQKPETHEIGTGSIAQPNEIENIYSIFIKEQPTIKEIPKNEIINKDKISIIYNRPSTKEEGTEGGTININEISEKNSLIFPKIKREMSEAYTEAKPEPIIKLDSKTEISIIKPQKELVESGTQKEIEENKINQLNQIEFLHQKPQTNELGMGNFSLGEGIEKININYLKEKKEYKDSETEPIKHNMELTKNDLSIIKPVKELVEADSQYRDPNLPTDKNKEIHKLFNKKVIKEKLYLGSILNRWKKTALGEKIKNEINNQKSEKLKIIFKIYENCLKKYIKIKFEEFVNVCKMPEKKIELIKNEDFNIIDIRPENEKVQLEGFVIERKKKPELIIDKKEEYNILKIEKKYKDEEIQQMPNLVENGVNPDIVQNQIIKNELINCVGIKKETTEEGTNPKIDNNEIINIPSINYTSIPKQLVDNETDMEKIPQEICTNESLNIIKPKKEYSEISIQYIDPLKRTSVTEILSILILKKININNLNLGKYFTKWYRNTKEDIISEKANIIIKHIKGYLVRKTITNNENKKKGLKKFVDIYEQLMIKILKKKWHQFVEVCKIEEKKLEPNQGENFSIIDIRPENKEEKINNIFIGPKEKTPLVINNIKSIDLFGKVKLMKDFGTQNIPEKTDKGVQNELPKSTINKNNQLSFLHTKKKMKDEYSQKEAIKPKITRTNLKIICKIKKKDEGQQIGASRFDHKIKRNESINIISKKPKLEQKIIVPNRIKRSESLEIISNKKELCEQEVQYIPQDNVIETQEIEIIRNKNETKDNSCQCIKKRPVICKLDSYSILMNKKKVSNNKYKIRTNTVTIIQNKRKVIDEGEQYETPQKYKSKLIIIGTNFKRGTIQKFYEIFEKIWKKKEKTKFFKNCKTTERETMLKKVLLRIALLKWRFIKGFGKNRYGIIYDRNGNEIGKKEGIVNDVSIQNNLDEEINKQILKNKQYKIKISKQNPIYIKSNIIYKPKIVSDMGTGDGPNHILQIKIDKINSISYKKKPKYKPVNKISKNSFRINKTIKKLKDQGTSMTAPVNKIVKGNPILYIKDNNLRNIYIRRRDLLTQIISKSIVREKYTVNKYFSKWHTKTVKIMRSENQKSIFKKVRPRIIKNEKFEILPKTLKREKSWGMNFIPQIVHNPKIEYKNSIKKKDVGTLINMPNRFKVEQLRTRKSNNDIYKSYKKPIIFRQIKGDSTSIFGKIKNDELGTPIGNEVEDEINIRITEIFVKFFKNRTSPKCILRKYLSIWYRNAQYMPLIDNAKIIANFCKSKFNDILIRKKWRKLYEKYLVTERQYNIIKILQLIRKRRYKLIRLLRMTRLMSIFNRRKFLHYIIMYWLIYTISTVKKRSQVKMLYENMLSTYVSMADDIFGRNKKNNPSIQDCMFEIIDTDKYQVKELEDVPMAKIYYSKKGEEKKIITNIKYLEKDIGEEKDYTFYKEIDKKEFFKKKDNINVKENKSDDRGNSYKRINNINKRKYDNISKNESMNDIQKGRSRYGKGYESYQGYKTETNFNTSNNKDDKTISKDKTKFVKGNYAYKSRRVDTDILNNNYLGKKYEKTDYSNKGINKTEIDNNNTFVNNINSQGEADYEKTYYSYEGHNKTDSNIIDDNVNVNANISQGGRQYGGGKRYNYRGYIKTDLNDNNNNNIDDSQGEKKYKKSNYLFKTYKKTESTDKNKNNNFRYSNLKIEETDGNNKQKENKYKRELNNNYFYNSNNTETKEQKKDETVKQEYKSYFNNKYKKNEKDNTRISTISNEKDNYNYNIKSASYSTNKPVKKPFYSRFHVNTQKYNNDEGK